MGKSRILYFFVWVVFFTNEAVAQFPLFQDGDRVCFIGNSITMNGRFHNYIELFYVTRFPEKRIEFYNCGISGDVSGGILRRMDSDILIHKPNWSVLMVGMNDVGRSQYSKERESEPGIKEKQQDALNRYFKNVDSIVRILLQANSKVILQTPSIYDQTAQLTTASMFGVNDALGTCANFLKELSRKYNLMLVDYWTIMNGIYNAIQKINTGATIIGPDRVHPGTEGHFVMAYQFLKTQRLPAYVSEITIQAKKNKIKRAEKVSVSDIKSNSSGLSFSGIEAALPYPLLNEEFNPDSLISFSNDLNKELLRIKSLKKGYYDVMIDSVTIGDYSAWELKKGINLATNIRTPQYQQSANVLKLFTEYWGLVRKLRQIKYVEYQLAGDDLKLFQSAGQDMGKLIEKRMERFKGQPKEYLDFYKRNFEEYLINKPMQNELTDKANTVFIKIHGSNKPTNHFYSIKRKE